MFLPLHLCSTIIFFLPFFCLSTSCVYISRHWMTRSESRESTDIALRNAHGDWRWHHHFTKNHFRSHAHLSSLDSNEAKSKSIQYLSKKKSNIEIWIVKQAFTTKHHLRCFSKPTKWYHMVAWTLERWNQVDNFAAASSRSSLSFSWCGVVMSQE